MIAYICSEKELRQKEFMKIMSVTESEIGWSWFVTFLLLHIATVMFTAAVSISLYEDSEGFFLFGFWVVAFVALISITMFMASLTTRATRGVLIGMLVLLFGPMLPMIATFDNGKSGLISLISLHPLSAMTYGLQIIGQLEDKGIGLRSSTVSNTDNPSGLTFTAIMSFLIADCFIWSALSWYTNRVIPPEFGQSLPVNFPFTSSFWFVHGKGNVVADCDESSLVVGVDDPDVPNEPVGEDALRQTAAGESIEIRKLRKEFGETLAVDDVTLSIYRGTSFVACLVIVLSLSFSSNANLNLLLLPLLCYDPNLNILKGEITALLGQNAAGKTTIIGLLTGAYAATGGSATVCGLDLKTQMGDIRRNTGICLQHDCLFPRLTVREHVQFFSRLKGQFSRMSHEEAEEHVDQVIKDLALFEKRNTYAKHLSGGMKRKLSVAIAFCGDSTVVLLDEPTSGMDPFSRRLTWNVIRQYRQNRCIVLTTHFMDEADVLGDRIAMLGQGRLRCVGSPLFLKKRYGVGYQLTIEKQHTKQASCHGSNHGRTCVSINDDSLCDRVIRDLVEANVPAARMLNNVGTEMIFQLPLDAASQFVPMFDDLDKEVASGSVSSYGIGITTLEEVFLLVARGGQEPDKKKSFRSSRVVDQDVVKGIGGEIASDATESSHSRVLGDNDLTVRHIRALFKKRAAYFRRDKKAWCCTTILPSIFVLAGFLMFKFIPPERAMETLPLTFDNYNTGIEMPPVNPLVFNAPGVYQCQPGFCAYSIADSAMVTPDERYYFCGRQARLPEAPTSTLCSVADSESVMSTLMESDRVDPISTATTDVLNVCLFRLLIFAVPSPNCFHDISFV
jgi:ABC-type multidrug transport system ATPase subunit